MRFSGNDLAPASPAAQTPLIDNLLKFGSGVISLIQQQQLAKTNLALIKSGQQPIQVSAVPGLTPTVAVGLDDSTRNLLLLGALGLGAVFVLPAMMRRRRR